MKKIKKICYLFILGIAIGVVMLNQVKVEAEELLQDADENGYYDINNKEELILFANMANKDGSISAELMNDINYNPGYVFNSDGTATYNNGIVTIGFDKWIQIKGYEGKFNGNGYEISGLYINDQNMSSIGLFGSTFGEAKISDVKVRNSYFKGDMEVGGIVGGLSNYGCIYNCSFDGYIFGLSTSGGQTFAGGIVGYSGIKSKIYCCYNSGNVYGVNAVGGIAGVSYSDINYCYNKGDISGEYLVGGIVGQTKSDSTTRNCYSLWNVENDSNKWPIDNGEFTSQNNYYLGTSESDSSDGTTYKTSEEFNSGMVTYLLNEGITDGTQAYYQTIGEGYPVFEGETVYYGYESCDATEKTYNNERGTSENHNYVWSYDNSTHTLSCSYCGDIKKEGEHEYKTNGVCECLHECLEEASIIEKGEFAGYYEINNVNKLYWFAKYVNEGNLTANAVLTNNIVINFNLLDDNNELNINNELIRSWRPITQFKGVLDGNGHSISGVYFNDETKGSVGLIVNLAENGIVKNLSISDSYFSARERIGGVVSSNSGKIEKVSFSGVVKSVYSISGGIVSTNSGTIINSYNHGLISGYAQIGGIAGANYSTIENCYNVGENNGSSDYVGPIVGLVKSQPNNCYYLSNIEDSKGGKTINQFNSGEVAYLLNNGVTDGTQAFYQTIGEGYPLFVGDTVYKGYYSCMDENASYSNTMENISTNYPCNFGDNNELEECLNGCGKVNFTLATITTNIPAEGYTFNGETFTPTFMIKFNDEELILNTHYVITGTLSEMKPGEYEVTFKGIETNGYNGEITYIWKIEKYVLEFEWSGYENLVFDGGINSKRVSANVIDWVENYEPSFYLSGHLANNVGNYEAQVILYETTSLYYTLEGSKTSVLEWEILPYEINDNMFQISFCVYNGKEQSCVISYPFSLNETTTMLSLNKDYLLKYDDNVNAGICNVTIIGIGNFTGTLYKTFTIKKAVVNVIIDDKTMNHYTDIPKLTYQVNGFVENETFISEPILFVDTDGKTIGEFDIIASEAVVSDNYEVVYTNGKLTVYEEHIDDNNDHICDYGCQTPIGECQDDNLDHACDYGCKKIYGEHSDLEDNNHLCDYGCGKTADEGCYDSVVDSICDECGLEISHNLGDFLFDADGHWHECENAGCEYKEEKTEHQYGDWIVTKEPTEVEKGSKTKKCECGHEIIEEIPMLEVTLEPQVNNGLSGGAIAGIISGVIALLGGLFVLYWFVIRKRFL